MEPYVYSHEKNCFSSLIMFTNVNVCMVFQTLTMLWSRDSNFMLLCVQCSKVFFIPLESVSVPFNYTPDIRSMWGHIVFAFPFVCSFVRSFVFPSQGQSFCVKVYKTSYFEDPLMDFVHVWHDGRYRSKVFISTTPTLVVTLGSSHGLRIFVKKVKVFCV